MRSDYSSFEVVGLGVSGFQRTLEYVRLLVVRGLGLQSFRSTGLHKTPVRQKAQKHSFTRQVQAGVSTSSLWMGYTGVGCRVRVSPF